MGTYQISPTHKDARMTCCVGTTAIRYSATTVMVPRRIAGRRSAAKLLCSAINDRRTAWSGQHLSTASRRGQTSIRSCPAQKNAANACEQFVPDFPEAPARFTADPRDEPDRRQVPSHLLTCELKLHCAQQDNHDASKRCLQQMHAQRCPRVWQTGRHNDNMWSEYACPNACI